MEDSFEWSIVADGVDEVGETVEEAGSGGDM